MAYPTFRRIDASSETGNCSGLGDRFGILVPIAAARVQSIGSEELGS